MSEGSTSTRRTICARQRFPCQSSRLLRCFDFVGSPTSKGHQVERRIESFLNADIIDSGPDQSQSLFATTIVPFSLLLLLNMPSRHLATTSHVVIIDHNKYRIPRSRTTCFSFSIGSSSLLQFYRYRRTISLAANNCVF